MPSQENMNTDAQGSHMATRGRWCPHAKDKIALPTPASGASCLQHVSKSTCFRLTPSLWRLGCWPQNTETSAPQAHSGKLHPHRRTLCPSGEDAGPAGDSGFPGCSSQLFPWPRAGRGHPPTPDMHLVLSPATTWGRAARLVVGTWVPRSVTVKTVLWGQTLRDPRRHTPSRGAPGSEGWPPCSPAGRG